MLECELEDFEDIYKDIITTTFFKIKKVVNKQLTDIQESLFEIKRCLDRFITVGKEKVDQKSIRSLNFFSDRIRKEIDDVEIPEEERTYDNLIKLLNSIKKLFSNINDIARKSLPRFQKEVQPQIKELNYITRKLGKKQMSLDKLLRLKYTDVRKAEDLLKKSPKLFTLRESIEKSKTDLDNFEEEFEERNQIKETLNTDFIELEKNELFKKLETERDNLFRIKMKITDKIGFKKALKKLKFELEKETIHIPNVNINYLKDFLKNPVSVLSRETKDLPNFSSLLVQLRRALEENKLNLKTDTKQKTIDQINIIFDEKSIQSSIEELKEKNDVVKEIERGIEDEGLAASLDNIKNKISINSVKLEHIENDLTRKNKDYLRYLAALKNEREEFQKLFEEITGEPLKLNITFTF